MIRAVKFLRHLCDLQITLEGTKTPPACDCAHKEGTGLPAEVEKRHFCGARAERALGRSRGLGDDPRVTPAAELGGQDGTEMKNELKEGELQLTLHGEHRGTAT